MPCEVYKQLSAADRSARQRWAQYAYQENAHLRGTSKTQAARIAREEKIRMGETGNAVMLHVGNCEICRSDREAEGASRLEGY